ncbi:SUMF1/EgtB/PvdO family nonheme iron enzyme [Pontibacter burrus]|uniref:SUMF1/EgtB/PvdO family nonheme iron enzyme n=1 Tax=Pontibacter burrus TaxID=2704466 RepID=A0A6B3LN26_9BACT|nr:SUMF1/EgtB/PvdO family nonheme iron enzyme [Pontibacter burrus]NEM98322.1 SUMF1/EgtB/PvdO family nonheme iron enzyme [Pontibacter burrus]
MFALLFILFLGTGDVPPIGTAKVKDYYIDRTEVLNVHWMEYMFYRKKQLDSAEVHTLYPQESNTWYTLPENYFKPIVLITYEQALDYCNWRSEVVSKNMNRKVKYTLPTKEEWSEIAEALLHSEFERINKELEKTKRKQRRRSGVYFVQNASRKDNRILNIFDNVSEMTLTEYVAMGGNNYSPDELDGSTTRTMQYNSPHLYLGFRCIAKFVDEE